MTTPFRPAFIGSPSFSVKPITLAVMHDDIPPGELSTALKNAVPQGFVGTSPYVVKTLDGEYLVYADGTAQFIPLGNSPGERAPLNGLGHIPIVNSGMVLGRLGPIRGRLGQAAASLSNRLLDVRVSVLLSRGAAIIPPVLKDAPYSSFLWTIMPLLGIWPERFGGYSGDVIRSRFPASPDIWTEAETENLSAVAVFPSDEELQDVSLIDSLYVTPVARLPVKAAWMTPKDVYAALHKILCDKQQRGLRQGYIGPGVGDPFYCTGASQGGYFRFTGWPSAAEYFGLKSNETWGEQRLAAHNAKVLADALLTYPFPGPIPLAPGFWYAANRQELAELANNPYIRLDDIAARFLITLLTYASYPAVSARIISWAEEKAKKKLKWAIIRIAAAVAIGFIFSAALAPALASIIPAGVPVSGATVASAITAVARDKFSKDELERISKEMKDAAKIFAVNDPAYAEQLEIAILTLEFFGAEFGTSADALSQMQEQAQNPPPTPEEFGVNTEYPVGSPLQKALLGVGAGAGVVGLLLFLLR